MKRIVSGLALLAVTGMCCAQQPTTVNFNLVQVNHYHGQEEVDKALITPGERIVIDLQNPLLRGQFLAAAATGQIDLASVIVDVQSIVSEKNGGIAVPWESHMVLRSSSGTDSFRVSSSRIGCPGTEVGPSVAVAFPVGNSWSDPPIRFGPLSANTICPLGKGYQLQVATTSDDTPVIRLHEPPALYGKR
ncbi:hypothetical protein KJ815_03935 [bacterium]|nr:hypothetical protein [bacterium]